MSENLPETAGAPRENTDALPALKLRSVMGSLDGTARRLVQPVFPRLPGNRKGTDARHSRAGMILPLL